jgi:acetylornithine deacetylase/succinyl-diaminopimelate desuccinylase-like protein
MIPQDILQVIETRRAHYLDELMSFLRIPSVSTYTHHAADMRSAANWALHYLQRLGFRCGLHETARHPVILGERTPHPGAPTLLIYGHYDVQPPEPLEEWLSPPFEPEIREGCLYARGATDDKGQLFTYLAAMDAILAAGADLPINVKVLIEGEEEIGSPNLAPFLRDHRAELTADIIAISDSSQFTRDTPAITYGLRGLAYLQIDIQGQRIDLHSGSFGGIVANPIQALAEMLARLKNPDGTVAIPGFYDDVGDLAEWERQEMAALAFDEAAVKNYLGVSELVGERGYSPLERKTARPTLDVNGIWGGFSGEGAKTVIAARAGAKVSMRLVPNQKSATIYQLFKDFIRTITPAGVAVQVKELHGAEPVLVAREHPSVKAAARAIEIGFGKPPVFIREGGSIPVVNLFKEMLGLDSLLLGWGCPDDGAHSPNERFRLQDLYHGIRAAAALLYEVAV